AAGLQAEQSRRFLQAVGLRALPDLDGQAAFSGGIHHPRMVNAHTSGAFSGSSATHSSSSARSVCHAANSTPSAAPTPSTIATTAPTLVPFFCGADAPSVTT